MHETAAQLILPGWAAGITRNQVCCIYALMGELSGCRFMLITMDLGVMMEYKFVSESQVGLAGKVSWFAR